MYNHEKNIKVWFFIFYCNYDKFILKKKKPCFYNKNNMFSSKKKKTLNKKWDFWLKIIFS
jgi:hypothetical protein